MNAALNIVPVQESEIDELRQVALVTFVDTFAADNDPAHFNAYTARTFTLENMTQEFHTPDSRFFFARLGDEIAGYLKLNTGPAQSEQELSNAMEIERIYARQGFHGQGVGKALMQHAVQAAHQAGMEWLWLGVWEKNLHAIEFYKRQGFQVFGEHSFLMGDEVQLDKTMKRPI